MNRTNLIMRALNALMLAHRLTPDRTEAASVLAAHNVVSGLLRSALAADDDGEEYLCRTPASELPS